MKILKVWMFFLLPMVIYSQNWELKKNENGIQVYTKKVPGSKILEFKAEAELETSAETILKVLKDTDHFVDWLADCKTSKAIKNDNKNYLSYYIEIAAPWPVLNRDAVIEVYITKTKNEILFKMDGLNNHVLKKDGIVRMPKFKGFWKLIKISEDKTKVIHQVHAESGGKVPAWLANAKVTDGPLLTLNNLKTKVEQELKE